MKPEDTRPGATYLVLDPDDMDWSLWQCSEDGRLNRMLVTWRGVVLESRETYNEPVDDWRSSVSVKIFEVRPENIAGIIMVARHMPDAEAWYRFARRQSERQVL